MLQYISKVKVQLACVFLGHGTFNYITQLSTVNRKSLNDLNAKTNTLLISKLEWNILTQGVKGVELINFTLSQTKLMSNLMKNY